MCAGTCVCIGGGAWFTFGNRVSHCPGTNQVDRSTIPITMLIKKKKIKERKSWPSCYRSVWVYARVCRCSQKPEHWIPLELDSRAIHKLPDMDAVNQTQVLCEVALILF